MPEAPTAGLLGVLRLGSGSRLAATFVEVAGPVVSSPVSSPTLSSLEVSLEATG
jgi:hypothetical protein